METLFTYALDPNKKSFNFTKNLGFLHHLPAELEHKAYWELKKLNLDLDAAGKKRMLQLKGKKVA